MDEPKSEPDNTGVPIQKTVQPKFPPLKELTVSTHYFGQNSKIFRELIHLQGLIPNQSTVQVGENGSQSEYHFSHLFQEKDSGRIYAFLKLKASDGKKYFRVVVRSQSGAEFRALPAVNKFHIKVPYLDKAIGEHGLILPKEVQVHLHEKALKGEIRILDDSSQVTELVEGGIQVNATLENYIQYAGVTDSLFAAKKIDLLAGSYDFKTPPENYKIASDFRVSDYRKPILKYPVSSPLFTDPVEAWVYSSSEGVEYTVYTVKDSKGQIKIWFSGKTQSEKINSFGVDVNVVHGGLHFIPLYEYETQIPPQYRTGKIHTLFPIYQSAWNFIRELPETQRWYKENSIPLPPKE